MSNPRFMRLDASEDVADYGSPPLITPPSGGFFLSPEPNEYTFRSSPAFTSTPSMHATDYNSAQHMHTVSGFANQQQQSQQQTPQMYGSDYNALRSDSMTENLLKKQRRGTGNSAFSRKASSIWSRISDVGVSNFAAPLFAAPWRHEYKKNSQIETSTVRTFDRRKQRRRILINGLLQWLIPAGFCGCLVGILWSYDQYPILSHGQKYTFNALLVGFSMCLGFAVSSGMKGYAEILRWRLLAGRYRELQDFELVMGCASQTKVLRLLWVGRTKGRFWPNGVQLFAFLYLLLMVGLQVVIACLGLTYSLDTSDEYVGTVRASTSVVNLTYFKNYRDDENDGNADQSTDPFVGQSGVVNLYGLSATDYSTVVRDTSDNTRDDTTYFTNSDRDVYWWYFADQCPSGVCNTNSQTPTLITPRYVTSAATCIELTIKASDQYGDKDNITYTTPLGDTSWMYVGTEVAIYATSYYANMYDDYGPRSTEIYVYNTGYTGSDDPNDDPPLASQLFLCNNTVSDIEQVPSYMDRSKVNLPDMQARLLAGSIGYSGTFFSGWAYQSQTYPTTSGWSWDRQTWTAEDAAEQIMAFTMGSVGALDNNGPRFNTPGDSPRSAQAVSVKWIWASAVLLVVPGLQLAALIATVIWANGAVIKDNSFLAAARLLRPVVDKLGNHGCALTGDEIAETLGNYKIIYGARVPGMISVNNQKSGGVYSGQPHMRQDSTGSISSGMLGGGGYGGYAGLNGNGNGYAHGGFNQGNPEGLLHLDIIEEREGLGHSLEAGWRPGRNFPQGRYDGFDDPSEAEEVDGNDGNEKKRRVGLLSGKTAAATTTTTTTTTTKYLDFGRLRRGDSCRKRRMSL